MLRKTALGIAAGLTLAVSAIAAAAPASASPHVSIGFGFGGYHGPHHGYWGPAYYGYGPSYCTIKKVKQWSHKHHKFVWKNKKICY